MGDERPPIPDEPAPPTWSDRHPRLLAWVQLIRLPNLFTVPGDPLVGYVLASAVVAARGGVDVQRDIAYAPALWAAAASVLLYAAGLVSNDLFDLEEDRRDRPARPLPSGRVSVRSAAIAAVVLFVCGIVCGFAAGRSAGFIACALTLLILIYNGGGKRVPLWGPMNMGACRGFSLLLGAVAVGPGVLSSSLVLVGAAGLTLYIASVTWLAAGETTGRSIGPRRWLPAVISSVWIVALITLTLRWGWATLAVAVAFALLVVYVTVRIAAELGNQRSPAAISEMVGELVAALVLLQALVFWGCVKGGLAISLGFIFFVFYGLARVLQKSFYAS